MFSERGACGGAVEGDGRTLGANISFRISSSKRSKGDAGQ